MGRREGRVEVQCRAIIEKRQGLPHYLHSTDAGEHQSPRQGQPGLDLGWCRKIELEGTLQGRRKKEGRQGHSTVSCMKDPGFISWLLHMH